MRSSRNTVTFLLLGLIISTSGCSAPKHSNTLIFGTNTLFALDASYDSATQQPNITIGYKRQELVWLPLMVNKAAVVQKDESTNGITDAVFQSQGSDNSRDAYSVIASFGTKHSASYDPTKGPVASGEISQYIATGAAAVLLAKTSGDRLVSSTEATKVAAQQESDATKIIVDTQNKNITTALDKLCKPGTNALDTDKTNSFLKKNPAYTDIFSAASSKDDVIKNLEKPQNIGRKPILLQKLESFTP